MHITELTGVGAKRAEALKAAGISSVADLLNYFPRDYDDRSDVKTLSELIPDAVNTVRGTVASEPVNADLKRKGGGGRFTVTKVAVKDLTGTLEITWFNQPYLKKQFKKGSEYIFTGRVREAFGKLQMQSPDYEAAGGNELSGGRIVPVYTPPKQFSQKTFRALIFQALSACGGATPKYVSGVFTEVLPAHILEKYNLCSREAAVRNIHFPENNESFLTARRRLVFEELFFMQLMLTQLKCAAAAQPGYVFPDEDLRPFAEKLSFALTNAQERVTDEIAADLKSGRRMNRLIQGDVGSGKTAVAFCAAFLAMKNGFQAAMMAPTDVLAGQIYAGCEEYFTPLGFEVVLLTGSIGAKAKREASAKIADGRASMIVGTHALIQKGVEYHRLGLCITDEQHRFGVNQRLTLTQKGESALPHTLVMTATPIPRTLALILYGDLDISVIDELPAGRREIKTYCVDSRYGERVRGFIRREAAAGRQAYIVCPAIEAAEASDETGDMKPERLDAELKNVIAYTAELSAALPEIRIAYLHGRMKPAEKERVMREFKSGETNVLVSTTVIEVGVHVENAALMIIENAERFGLSQLHQLRGRVGRGDAQSYCVLITDSKNKLTQARMKAVSGTTDGFKLAELDLEQRGGGDFFGTRQHGLPSFKIANLYRDTKILNEAQEAAGTLHEINLSPEEKRILKHRTEETEKSAQTAAMTI